MRIVLDTNVVVSGLLKAGGVAGAFWGSRKKAFALRCSTTNASSQSISRCWQEGLDRRRIEQVIEALRAIGELVVAKPIAVQSPDPDDQMFIEVAVTGFADAIVTGNAKHFPTDCGVSVLSPAQLLRMIG